MVFKFGKVTLLVLATLVVSGMSAGAFDFDVQGTKVTLGGYAKLMMTYDTDGTVTAPYNGDLYSIYGTPIDGSKYAETDDFRMTARESRLFVKTATASEYGLFETHIEGDFFADIDSDGPTWSNSNGFRIRHGYGKMTMGNHVVLAGQTWSTFMDLAAAVPAMDFSTDPGVTFVRQAQLRYQYNLAKGHYVAFAIENPTYGMSAAGPATLVNAGDSEDKMPDLVLKYFYANKRFHISPKVLLRRFELDGDAAYGYGLSLTSHVNLGTRHKAYFGVLYGDGIGRYAGLGINAGAGINSAGDTETVKLFSVNGGLLFTLHEKVRLALGAGYSEQDDDAYAAGVLTAAANKEAFSWHTNLYWDITPKIQYAVGMTSGKVENMGGGEGDMIRIQSYLKYTF